MNKSFKYIFIFSFILINILIINNNYIANAAIKKKKKIFKKSKKKKLETKIQIQNKRKFDEIKEFYSYDPVTGKWSKIEDFETVELLESRKEKRKEEYIYKDFWAYDYKTRQWYKVDISAFGYKNPKETNWNKIFKNLAFDVGTGFGIGQHDMYLTGNDIYISNVGCDNLYKIVNKDGVPIGSTNQNNTKKSLVLGFLQLINSFQRNNDTDNNNNISRSERDRKALKVYGFEPIIPFFCSLHYTFNKQYRVGLDLEFALNFLEYFNIRLQGKEQNENIRIGRTISGLKKQGMFMRSPTYIFKPSIYLAYSIYRWDSFNDILLDLQFGPSLYLTDAPKFRELAFFNFRTMIGIRYERRFGNYGRLFTKIGPEFEYGKIIEIDGKGGARGDLISRAIRLNIQVGIGTYFGKDNEIDKAVKNQLREIKKRQKARKKKLARETKKKKLKQRYKSYSMRMKKRKKKK
ncbi:MAG: hypothetical protein GY830_04190 [Bacteroidetes bacterium]|nr:hypothetical protein [Bacteroidota bacterium]